MNYQTWSKKKFWVIMIAVFVLGIIIAPKGTTREIVREVSKISNDCRELKEIDDTVIKTTSKVILIAGGSAGLCSQAMTAIVNNDAATLRSITVKVTDSANSIGELNSQIKILSIERQTVLNKLGY